MRAIICQIKKNKKFAHQLNETKSTHVYSGNRRAVGPRDRTDASTSCIRCRRRSCTRTDLYTYVSCALKKWFKSMPRLTPKMKQFQVRLQGVDVRCPLDWAWAWAVHTRTRHASLAVSCHLCLACSSRHQSNRTFERFFVYKGNTVNDDGDGDDGDSNNSDNTKT